MEFKLVPAINQRFDIGRTINFTKCDCEKCDFMHCPKNNYALKIIRQKYSVQDFFAENKEAILQKRSLRAFFGYETITDFIDSCIGGFPNGTYWDMKSDDAIELVSRNRSKHGADFLPRAKIYFYADFPITYYVGCTDGQEKCAEKIQKLLRQLDALLISELSKE